MISILHRYESSLKKTYNLRLASTRDRIIAQLIDGFLLAILCNLVFYFLSSGSLSAFWISPIIPQFLIEVENNFSTDLSNIWWGGYFFSIHLPYGKEILLNYPAPLLYLIYCLYYAFFMGIVGQTPGKMMKKIVVLNNNKELIGISTGLKRWFFSIISLLPFGMGFWWTSQNKENKTWHDLICNTSVFSFD